MSKTSKFRMSDRSENSAVHKDSVGAEKDMLCGADGLMVAIAIQS